MPYYVKVKPEVRARILPSHITGTKAKDGNIILFQSDLIGVDGATLSDRVTAIGGALLTPNEAKQEIDGTKTPAYCYDPEAKQEMNMPEDDTPKDDIPNEELPDNAKEESEVEND